MENLFFLPRLSKSEQFELVKQARLGDEAAKTRLIMSCSGLVKNRIMQLVNENTWCYPRLNLIYEDLFNIGLLGVSYALENFDVSKNTSFSSYSFFWIDAFLRKEFATMRKSNCSQEEFDETVTDEANEAMFSSVMRLLRCAEVRDGQSDFVSTLDIMFNDLKDKNPEHIAVRQYAVFKQAAGKTAQSILVSCSVRLTIFNMRSIENLTSVDNIDLASIGDKPTALFCITPIVDTTFNFLVAMMYTQLFETLYFHAENHCKGCCTFHRQLQRRKGADV